MTNQYFLDRIAGRDPDLRAADADRERIAARLRKSHAEGRLDLDEFQQRLERCYESKTLGELRELVRDLPRQDEQGDQRSFASLRLSRWRLGTLVPVLIVLLFASAVSGHHGHHVLWVWIPLVFVLWRISWWRRRRQLAGARRGPNDWI